MTVPSFSRQEAWPIRVESLPTAVRLERGRARAADRWSDDGTGRKFPQKSMMLASSSPAFDRRVARGPGPETFSGRRVRDRLARGISSLRRVSQINPGRSLE